MPPVIALKLWKGVPIRGGSRTVAMPNYPRPSPYAPLQVLVVDPDDLTRQQVADFMVGQSLRVNETPLDHRNRRISIIVKSQAATELEKSLRAARSK